MNCPDVEIGDRMEGSTGVEKILFAILMIKNVLPTSYMKKLMLLKVNMKRACKNGDTQEHDYLKRVPCVAKNKQL